MNLDELRLPPNTGFTTTGKAPRKAPRPRAGGRFLKGPVPWPWLQRAMQLPGKALAVGLMLWLQHGLTGRRTVHFCLAHAVADGIPTTTARRAIRELERAGLGRVDKSRASLAVWVISAAP